MIKTTDTWNIKELFESLENNQEIKLMVEDIELIDDEKNQRIIIQLSEYSDMIVTVKISGDQILTNVMLWPVEGVKNKAALDALLLKSSAKMPLSSFGISMHLGQEYYEIFGALSAKSDEHLTTLDDIILEIKTLSENIHFALDLLVSVSE